MLSTGHNKVDCNTQTAPLRTDMQTDRRLCCKAAGSCRCIELLADACIPRQLNSIDGAHSGMGRCKWGKMHRGFGRADLFAEGGKHGVLDSVDLVLHGCHLLLPPLNGCSQLRYAGASLLHFLTQAGNLRPSHSKASGAWLQQQFHGAWPVSITWTQCWPSLCFRHCLTEVKRQTEISHALGGHLNPERGCLPGHDRDQGVRAHF